MPDDPVKAVWWFLYWLLQLLVNFFWFPVIGMTIYETLLNWNISGISSGILSGLITLLVGLSLWIFLYVLRRGIALGIRVSQVLTGVNQFQNNLYRSPIHPFVSMNDENNHRSTGATSSKVVEGSIVKIEEEPLQQ